MGNYIRTIRTWERVDFTEKNIQWLLENLRPVFLCRFLDFRREATSTVYFVSQSVPT